MSSLPKYYGFYTPFLTALQDQKVHTSKEIQADIAQMLNLSDEQLSEVLPSGTQSVFCNRIGWAKTYLKKAGLIESSKRVATPFQQRGFLSCIVVLPSPTHCWHSAILLLPLLSMAKERNPPQKSLLLKLLSMPRKPRPKRWIAFIATSIINLPMICFLKS